MIDTGSNPTVEFFKSLSFYGPYSIYNLTLNFKKVVGMNHYLAGIEYFQEEYGDKNLIFLAVSDDIAWVQKHLGKIKGIMKIMCMCRLCK